MKDNDKPYQRVVAVERPTRGQAGGGSALSRPLPRWVVWLLGLLALSLALIVLPHFGSLHVYQKHFRADAPEIALRFEELSPRMNEAAVKEYFKGLPLWCMPEQQSQLGNRVCVVSLAKANGVPALGLALFLRDGNLRHAILQVPWWAHSQVQAGYSRDWGSPAPAGSDGSGKAVVRWKLTGGQVEMNKTRYLGPLSWSTVLWSAGA